ncbi:hypothetical protein [Stenomitos frigidus]|uniref:Uncharacterized protein n=1 Tax=Stenomitos frigidus ULC18 TaxID=2107698 RepID=A0A2T1DXG5_9CYAN|nr:hypothetical protein [Stenomitos frigidus]PSB25131.1 hypothetical protein C7B82_24460 [Stenomitos frigidus ULC18]
MSQLPNDDHELVDFLKQHRPQTPPADPVLEERLFAAIESQPQQDNVTPLRRSQPRVRRSIAWFVPPTLAAGLLVSVIGYRLLMPAKPSATELANLQAFIESNWQGTVNSGSTDEETPLFNDVTN